MAPKKPTTTVTKTITGVTEFVEHSTDVQLTPMPSTGRPYILESAEFDAFIDGKKKAAQREIDDLDSEIARLEVEIEARYQRRADLAAIIDKANAALGVRTDHIARQSPRLVEKAVAE
jgi:hypothetical protein